MILSQTDRSFLLQAILNREFSECPRYSLPIMKCPLP